MTDYRPRTDVTFTTAMTSTATTPPSSDPEEHTFRPLIPAEDKTAKKLLDAFLTKGCTPAAPQSFHSLTHHLSLYILTLRDDDTTLHRAENQMRDLKDIELEEAIKKSLVARKHDVKYLREVVLRQVFEFYKKTGFSASPFRLEYVYDNTNGPCELQTFLVESAARRIVGHALQYAKYETDWEPTETTEDVGTQEVALATADDLDLPLEHDNTNIGATTPNAGSDTSENRVLFVPYTNLLVEHNLQASLDEKNPTFESNTATPIIPSSLSAPDLARQHAVASLRTATANRAHSVLGSSPDSTNSDAAPYLNQFVLPNLSRTSSTSSTQSVWSPVPTSAAIPAVLTTLLPEDTDTTVPITAKLRRQSTRGGLAGVPHVLGDGEVFSKSMEVLLLKGGPLAVDFVKAFVAICNENAAVLGPIGPQWVHEVKKKFLRE